MKILKIFFLKLKGEKFEKLLGEIILELLQEQINENETRDNNTKKSDI